MGRPNKFLTYRFLKQIIEFIVVEAASNFKQATTAAVVQKNLRRMVKDLLRRTFETISSGFFMKPVHGWNHWNPGKADL